MGPLEDVVPQRIAVIGNGGGGKSTLCQKLGATLHLPVHAIDSVQFKPGWVPAPLADVRAAHDRWLAEDRWIIDGWGEWSLIEQRFAAADIIIFVDFPLWRHFWWATKRAVASMWHRLSDEPEGCSYAQVQVRMYKTLWRVHHRLRPRLVALLAGYRERVWHVQSRRQLTQMPTLVL
jgi:adenylate kinase family enzyme